MGGRGFSTFFLIKGEKTLPIWQKLGGFPTLTFFFLNFIFGNGSVAEGNTAFFSPWPEINSYNRLWGARFKIKQNKQAKNSTKYLCNLKNVQSLLIMQNMVLIQCIYNAIHDLAAILVFGSHLTFYRHIEMV